MPAKALRPPCKLLASLPWTQSVVSKETTTANLPGQPYSPKAQIWHAGCRYQGTNTWEGPVMHEKSTSRCNPLRNNPRSYANNAGFTLVEVVLVVVIIGFIAAIAGPSFINLNKQLSLESTYQDLQRSLQRCRTEGLNAERSTLNGVRVVNTTISPAMALFSNGYACVLWHDVDSNSVLGTGGAINMGIDGLLNAGDANAEVVTVYFQKRFDPSKDLNAVGSNIFLASGLSVLSAPASGQTDASGYLFVIAPAGYYLTNTNTMMVLSIEIQQPPSVDDRFNLPGYHPARFCLLPSGQTIPPENLGGVC